MLQVLARGWRAHRGFVVKMVVVGVVVAGVALAGCSSEKAQLSTAECVAVVEQRSANPPADGSVQADLAALGCGDVPVVAATTTTPPVTTTTVATTTTATPTTTEPVVAPEPVVVTAMTDAECDAYAASSPLPNAQLFPEMRAIGCGARLDELEAAATASAEAEASSYQMPSYQAPSYPAPTATYELPSCPAGEVFSGLGGGCMSAEDAARISYNEGLCGGGYGPVEVCGPGRQGG